MLSCKRRELSAYHSLHSYLWPLPGVVPTLVPREWVLVVVRCGASLSLGGALRLGGAYAADYSRLLGREWSAGPRCDHSVAERQQWPTRASNGLLAPAMADWRKSTAQTRGDQGAGT